MPWMQIILFLIKYGTGILSLVKGIWELVEWLRDRDAGNSFTFVGGRDKASMKKHLAVMARCAKERGDLSELKAMRDMLAKRKAEIEGIA